MRDVRKFGPRMNGFHKSRSYSEAVSSRFLRGAVSIIATLISVLPAAVVAQQPDPQHWDGVTIQGKVLNSAGRSIGDASVWLEQEDTLKRVETKTNTAGGFAFTALPPGRYLLSAEKSWHCRSCTAPGRPEKYRPDSRRPGRYSVRSKTAFTVSHPRDGVFR